MLIVSEKINKKFKSRTCTVYTREPIHEGCECFGSNKGLTSKVYFVNDVNVYNIAHDKGRFFYTNEDMSIRGNWWPAHLLPVIGAFVSTDKHKSKKTMKTHNSKKLSNSFIVDASELPAFSTSDFIGMNEDLSIHEYRLYLTLFHPFTIKQVQFERHELYDAQFNCSKYDLVSRIQSSDCLKSKDFTMINHQREKNESVEVGIVLKEGPSTNYTIEYGRVYINMANQISIIWH